jgi:hypothetical protein
MVEPVAALTAAAIAHLAFQEMVKSGAGEVGKTLSAGTVNLLKKLRESIRTRLSRNSHAAASLSRLEQGGGETSLKEISDFLANEMERDPTFADNIRNLAQQIVLVSQENITTRQYMNEGRDQINIEQIRGNPKIGGS